ncbi:hypothetical protein DER45DRAFT_576839 [Fusarium avenaceum]|nr:hypothetical protein DER45DRAFT_576839 [Fusarium avenaceum]
MSGVSVVNATSAALALPLAHGLLSTLASLINAMWRDGPNQCRLCCSSLSSLFLDPNRDDPGLDAPKLHQSRVNQSSLVRPFQNPEMSTVSVEGIDPLGNQASQRSLLSLWLSHR